METEFYLNSIKELEHKTIFVTGATGLIGKTFIKYILRLNDELDLDIKIIALVRSREKADNSFDEQQRKEITFILGTVEELPVVTEHIDYIVHGASPTASDFFVNNPVETIQTNVYGTNNLLKLAIEKNIDSFVYLSSMEVYGTQLGKQKLTENDLGAFSVKSVRNSYPLSKQMCENLCLSYWIEYNVPIKIARLAQTFGAEIDLSDKRVFAEFTRCVIEHKKIILKTAGRSAHSYLYSEDAVTAIILLLVDGSNGEIYNVANEDTYCSILEMAQLLADKYNLSVEVQKDESTNLKYPKSTSLDLDTAKIKRLGWKSTKNLLEMYDVMVEEMKRKKRIG